MSGKPKSWDPADTSVMRYSNSMLLTGRQWLGLSLFMLALIVLASPLWRSLERFEPGADYRIPYALSEDYWHFDRWSGVASRDSQVLFLGDSVVWGEYVTRDRTLSAHLNAIAQKPASANLGVNGMHPVALAGLIEHYGGALRDRKVLLHCNPLWLSSPKHDLQGSEAFDFQHPRLAPQDSTIPCYNADLSTRISAVVERNLAFNAWTRHLQFAYFDGKSIPAWTLDHPKENPASRITLASPPSQDRRHDSKPWFERSGSEKLSMDWVKLESSIQWASFRRAVALLKDRGCKVFVLVGPYNEHLLSSESRAPYAALRAGIEAWLRANEVAFVAPAPVSSELYADASHPLDEGYRQLAQLLYQDGFFR
jgi:hypothetical protein